VRQDYKSGRHTGQTITMARCAAVRTLSGGAVSRGDGTAFPGSAVTAATVFGMVFDAPFGRQAGEHLGPRCIRRRADQPASSHRTPRSGLFRNGAKGRARAGHRRCLVVLDVDWRQNPTRQHAAHRVNRVPVAMVLLGGRSAPLEHEVCPIPGLPGRGEMAFVIRPARDTPIRRRILHSAIRIRPLRGVWRAGWRICAPLT
jgi:hypothetical protein